MKAFDLKDFHNNPNPERLIHRDGHRAIDSIQVPYGITVIWNNGKAYHYDDRGPNTFDWLRLVDIPPRQKDFVLTLAEQLVAELRALD